MNWLLGLNKVWTALDGWKTYIAGGASLLTGVAGLLTEIVKLINDKSATEAFHWLQSLPQDQSWMLVLAGLAAIGLRHSDAKTQSLAK